MDKHNVCLINDSFPPEIDGVANAVTNYARIISQNFGKATVVTPDHPQADDGQFPFPVVRYPSIDMTKYVGYRAGLPFSAEIQKRLETEGFDIIHSHCPITSTMLARTLRYRIDVPVVFTYHTKFDIDIANAVNNKLLQEEAKKLLVQNIASCNEVWTVSHGAGENMHKLGYEGGYIVMPNGVDFPKGRVSEEQIHETTADYDLPENTPVFLFVGRMMWYKGIRIILDSLKMLEQSGQNFRMVFVGGGTEKEEIEAYAQKLKLGEKVFFAPPIHDREKIRAWYCRADCFLFPSTFDTNGLVVREAAACALGSVLIAGSCAAEDVTDGLNGFLIEENAEAMASKLQELCNNREKMAEIGAAAQRDLYMSWDTAVANAYERYGSVIDNYKRGLCPTNDSFGEDFFRSASQAMGAINRRRDEQLRRKDEMLNSYNEFKNSYDAVVAELKEGFTANQKKFYGKLETELQRRQKQIKEYMEDVNEHVDRFL